MEFLIYLIISLAALPFGVRVCKKEYLSWNWKNTLVLLALIYFVIVWMLWFAPRYIMLAR